MANQSRNPSGDALPRDLQRALRRSNVCTDNSPGRAVPDAVNRATSSSSSGRASVWTWSSSALCWAAPASSSTPGTALFPSTPASGASWCAASRHPKPARWRSGSPESGSSRTCGSSPPNDTRPSWLLRAEAERPYRGGGVDHSITKVVVPAAPGQVAGAALKCALELRGRERRRREALAQRRGDARGHGARGRRAPVHRKDARANKVAEAGEVRFAGVEPARSLRRITEAAIGDRDGGDGDDVGMGIRAVDALAWTGVGGAAAAVGAGLAAVARGEEHVGARRDQATGDLIERMVGVGAVVLRRADRHVLGAVEH